MAHKLNKPFTDIQRARFICGLEHLNYYEDDNCIIMYLDSESVIDGVVTDISQTTEYISEQAQKEAERIAGLNLTGADVERAIYKAFEKDFKDIRTELEVAQIPGLDLKALDIELKANFFYRGNPYINAVGQFLGISAKQLDRFFETNNFEELAREEIPQSA